MDWSIASACRVDSSERRELHVAGESVFCKTKGMKDGVDAKELAARLKAASPEERSSLISNYKAWIVQGARAQGWRGWVGGMVLGGSVFLAFSCFIAGVTLGWIYVLATLGSLIGFCLVRVAFRRERDWRRRNPFPLSRNAALTDAGLPGV